MAAAPLLALLALAAVAPVGVTAPAANGTTTRACKFNASAHLGGLSLPPAARRALRSGGPLQRDVEWRRESQATHRNLPLIVP